MLVLIRADASQTIGSGHIMRCLTLADQLRLLGAEVSFVCRDFPGNLSEYIRSKGFEVHLLSEDEASDQKLKKSEQHVRLGITWESDVEQTMYVIKRFGRTIDWLIVDHYAIDHRWQSHLRLQVRNIMVIDDLANRRHDCDILLDQNYYHNMTERYTGLVHRGCSLFLGPRYLLLREEFHRTREKMRIRTGEVSNILMFYGGADTTNETEKCLMVLCDSFSPKLEINVVTGHSNPNKERIKDICSSRPNIHYHCQVSNISDLMNKADLAIGAGGSAIWERCFLGLPSIVTIVAENQVETTEAVADFGAILNLGWHDKVDKKLLCQKLHEMINNPFEISRMRQKSLELLSVNQYEGFKKVLNCMFY